MMTTYEIHDYVMSVIRCEPCHRLEVDSGRIARGRIADEGDAGRGNRYERVAAEANGIVACDRCGGQI